MIIGTAQTEEEKIVVTSPQALGERMHTDLLKQFGLSTDVAQRTRLDRIQTQMQRTRLMADRFQVVLLGGEMFNAFTTPGRYIYFSQRLQERLTCDEAVACVLGHEMAHHDLGHIRLYEKRLATLDSVPASALWAILLTVGERLLFSPEWEIAADAHGLTTCLNLGYDGTRCIETFDVLERHALERSDTTAVYGPASARTVAATPTEAWIARADTWVWQRARGYPSLSERKERLRVLLEPRAEPLHLTRLAAPTTLGKPPQMTLDQIDQALETWRAKLLAATDNLLALDDNLTYKRLEGKDGLPVIPLRGLTQKRVAPALEAIHDLFKYTGLIGKVLEQATELRRTLSRFRNPDATIREIERLLYGPSIALPTGQTPLAQRSLLSAAETANLTTPDRLLTAMIEEFEVARDAIFAVDVAWGRLEESLGRREAELTTLQRLAETAGVGTLPELATARQRAAAIRAQIESDPLGATANFDAELAPLLRTVRERLGQIAEQREQVVHGMAQAQVLLAELAETHHQCETALADCQTKIGNVPGLCLPLDPARIAELAQWLVTLETAWQEGRWQAARIGLERWRTTGTEYLNAERAALAANLAPVELSAELRGRLAALKMKARARGLTQDTALNTLAEEAERLLHTFPVPLERIGSLVKEFEKILAAHSR